ncbi:sensor histidine kinase [Streptomyces sp. SID12501]|uniref:Sensor histidine kinase n=1 Tax=Streptomyces sp. SID12501 TaxID=2706042 RepID=A0A6B3BSU1_9ACTN|nr:sensor histidine kinase [Streptomyces sp. SID12501]NEC87370.1 sensor histidine kinase [Streptomyces sp. SID12501]
MSASLAVSACPISTDLTKAPPPSPDTLTYGFTLPAEAVSSRVARATTRVVLQTHGLEEMADAAVQVVGELTACAFRFAADASVYVSLRWWEAELQVVLYDGHRRHVHPRLAAACDERRGDALRVLGCVVEGCGGEWGFGEAREPGEGTRMWAVLPWAGAREFAAVGVGRA